MTRLTCEPLIPASLWLLLAAASIALLVTYAARRRGGITRRYWALVIGLMSGGVALVLVVLLNPTWIDPVEPPAGKPLLTLLVDESASMAVKDGPSEASRFDAVRQIAQRMQAALQGRFDVRVRSFSTGLAAGDAASGLEGAAAPRGVLTDIAGALSGSVEPHRPAGQAIVLLSDGIHNATPGHREVLDAVRAARAAAAPIYTFTAGRRDAPELFDRQVQIRSPQVLAYVQQKVPIIVRVREQAGPGGAVRVLLFAEGQPIDGKDITLPPRGTAEARFTVSRDTPGVYRYEARLDPAPGELVVANNLAVEFLHVVDEPIRVLLLEGKPYWDGKFLMRTLIADPVIALDSVVRMTGNRYLRRTLRGSKAGGAGEASSRSSDEHPDDRGERWKIVETGAEVLAGVDALKDYQVLVLGRDTEVFLTDAAMAGIRRWVAEKGGALVCYRGSPAVQMREAFARMLPVQWDEADESRFRVHLTDEARSVRWLSDLDDPPEAGLLARLPMLATTSRVDARRSAATVLASATTGEGRERPVISCQLYGTGRVVAIEGAGMWRWAFLPPQHAEDGALYGALWQSLMRWLASDAALRPGQQLDLRSEKVVFEAGEAVWATLRMAEEVLASGPPAVELRISGANAAIGRFVPAATGTDPGTFRVGFGRLPAGEYEAHPVGAEAVDSVLRFDVRVPVREQLELAARPDLMERMAVDSGGAVLQQADPREVAVLFDAFTKASQPQRARRIPVWDRWYVLVGVLGVWAACWGVRRAGGLI